MSDLTKNEERLLVKETYWVANDSPRAFICCNYWVKIDQTVGGCCIQIIPIFLPILQPGYPFCNTSCIGAA